MAGGDIDMAPSSDDKKIDEKKEEKKEEKAAPPPPPTPVMVIKTNIALIERAVSTLEPRFTHRVLRSLSSLRRKIDDKVLREAISEVYVNDVSVRDSLLSWLPVSSNYDVAAMEIDSEPTNGITKTNAAPAKTSPTYTFVLLPETEIYFRILLLHHLLSSSSTYDKTTQLAHESVEKIQKWNRRTLDPLAARVWFAIGRAYEIGGKFADIRPLLLAAQRTASLRRDDECEAVILNLLLRNYLSYSLYDQADKLVSKTTFPTSVGNPQHARYYFYLGRIKAVQLNYTAAHTNLQQAIRRAPNARTAPGFFQAVHKFSIVVDLLMGDIPERSLFRHPVLEKALEGYFEIVKAVRTGSLTKFQSTLAEYKEQFTTDRTYTLIVRLRQNVIKTGVRRLSLSYSRISLRDICIKLHLDSEEDAEYILGKAIRDGVIDGKVVHSKGWMECGGGKGGYGPEVSDVFGRRIGYCLDLHNESIKAMRYPLNAHRKELAAAEGAREREKELAKEIQDGEIDEEPDIEGF